MLDFIEPGYLAWIAGGLYAIGYLIINQVALRLMVLLGTIFYIWYYWVAADVPLWDAIIASVILGTANLIGLANLLFHKSSLYVPRAHRDIYGGQFSHMLPADFRVLMQDCRRERLETEQIVTTEDGQVKSLYYVLAGEIGIEKLGERFWMPSGLFVGEIAYLTGRNSSATTWLPAGSEVLIWDFETLRKRSDRNPRFKLAFEAMISRDLAMKVAVAVAPHDPNWNVDTAREKLLA